jgi:SAM domain (Sterile alpha motif)
MLQIADWLEKLGMSEYAQRFAENRIDFSVLPDLTDQDLKDLGVVLGDRRKMLRAIAELDAVTLMPRAASTLSVATEQPVRVAEESVAGVVGMASRQWSAITEFYQYINQTEWTPQTQVSRKTPSAQSKFSGRIPQEQGTGQVSRAPTPGAQTTSAVAQQVVLHEEDGKDQQGRRYVGSAIWRTEALSRGIGLAPEIAVLADAEIPERSMTVAWSLRRNTDKALPASHTIEIKFNVPADFPGGGIANVPGILMAQADQVRGTPLSGLAVKMTDGFFIIGLSAVDPDMQLNEEFLKGRSWFYIPIVYTNGGRAILAMEKGPPGDRAFAEAFAAWEKK